MEDLRCQILTDALIGRKLRCHVPLEAQRRGTATMCIDCRSAGHCLVPEMPGSTYADLGELAPFSMWDEPEL